MVDPRRYGTRKIEQFRKAGLPYYQWEPGGKIFYKRSDLQEWVERCRRIDTPEIVIAEPIDLGIERLPFEAEEILSGDGKEGQD